MSNPKFWLQTGVTDPVKGVCYYHVVLAVDYEALRTELAKVTANRDYWRETSLEKNKWLETGKQWKIERDAALAKLESIKQLAAAEIEAFKAEAEQDRAQLAAARADTERLNWLEKAATEDHPSFPMLDNGEWCYPLIVGQGTVHAGVGTCVFKTIRAAIDSAKEG